ncbi:PriCT-2 domain-containing protein [Methylobacterium sp. CM6257]
MTTNPHLEPTELRLALRSRGFHPVPVSGPTMNVKSAGKRPMMPAFQHRCLDASPEEIMSWSRLYPDSVNTGLLCGHLAGVDIDVLDPALSASIANRARKILGPTPLERTGRQPKLLLAYRLPISGNKIQTAPFYYTDDPLEKPTKVEVLLRGHQFVAFGIHPETAAPYSWSDASPLSINFADVPETSEAELRRFIAEAETLVRDSGAATSQDRRQTRRRQETKGRLAAAIRSGEAPDVETIASALKYVPNNFDYDGWVRIGFALYDGLGEAGRGLWEAWSATSPRNDPSLTSRKWSTFARGHTVTVATLFWHASENGWKRSGSGQSGAPKRNRADYRANVDPEAPPEDEDGRPIVRFVAGKVPKGVDRMEAILLNAGVQIYSRAGTLVRPVIQAVPAAKGRMTSVARMRALSTIGLADIAAQKMRFQRYDVRAEDWLDINPPDEITATLLAREGQWRVPPVVGVITAPTVRPDGTILDLPGYDPATQLYYAAAPDFRLPSLSKRPDKTEALRALALIEELLIDFPFVSHIDRSVALSGVLTALVRSVIPTAPMHAIRAYTPGTGKSYLIDLISIIAAGRRCPVITAGKSAEETEKRLGALLRDGVSVISIDNVNGELGGDMLCQLTERPLVRVRILGKSEAPELECRSAVFATGNNLVLVGDMTRRALVCSLDAKIDNPEQRTFKFDPILQALTDRGAYVAAALTVIRAYRVAGAPSVCGPLGSYEEWTEMVRSPLVWLGQADPVSSMEIARDEDPELSAIRELFEHWREHLSPSSGYTTSAIIRAACEKGPGASFDYIAQEFRAPEFRDLLLRQAGEGGAVNSRRLGKWLSRIKGRVVGGYRLEMKADSSNGNRFSLNQVDGPPTQTDFNE